MREGSHDASGRHESRHCGGDNDMVQVYMHTHNTQGQSVVTTLITLDLLLYEFMIFHHVQCILNSIMQT